MPGRAKTLEVEKVSRERRRWQEKRVETVAGESGRRKWKGKWQETWKGKDEKGQ